MATVFEYYPVSHTYWLDGKQIPSVTELVSVYGPDMDADEMEEQLAPATERGTVMHDYIFRRLSNFEPEEIELPSMYQEYADGVELFLSEHTFIPEALERPMYSDRSASYGGTPDYFGWFDDIPTILDWKFVSTLSKHKVAAQLGGYAVMVSDFLRRPVRQMAAVQFLPGTYRLYRTDPRTALSLFLPCAELAIARETVFDRGTLIAHLEEENEHL